MTTGSVLVVVGLVLLYAAALVRLHFANKAIRELAAQLNRSSARLVEVSNELDMSSEVIRNQARRIEQLSPGGPGVACCHEVEQCRHRKLFPGDAPVQFGVQDGHRSDEYRLGGPR